MAKQFKHDDLEFARAVTFFDAIFAFSVTLLITTVDDFSPAAWSSWQALKDTNGPSLLAFSISFVVVVSFWRVNHQTVTAFNALDSRLITLNCTVMFGVVLIPFATEAMGKLNNLPLPTAVYAVVISVTFIVQCAVLFVADYRGMNGHKLTPLEIRWELLESAALPVIFLGSIPVAYLVGPASAQQCWIILAVLMPVLGTLHKKAMDKEQQQLSTGAGGQPAGKGVATPEATGDGLAARDAAGDGLAAQDAAGDD